jgi:hypothetical protein
MPAQQGTARTRIGVAVAFAVLLGIVSVAGRAAAEAPFFYDDVSVAATYDSTFNPMNRHAGLLALMVQGWSYPTSGVPRQSVFEQDYAAEYRLQWWASLDPRYSLLVELKGSSLDQVVADDYFLKSEFLYQGAHAPVWIYGGMRLPEKTNFMVYGGVESMSMKLQDMLPSTTADLPVAFRGWAELRYDIDDTNPTLRLMGMGHTLPGWGVENLTLTAGLDTFFKESAEPIWLVEAHAEYAVTPPGFARLSVLAGYAIDLKAGGEQRLSLGGRLGLF